MILNETQQKWSNIITEEYNVKDPKKVAWMSKYAQVHELHEGVQQPGTVAPDNLYANPLNTLGMGNPLMPYNADPTAHDGLVGKPGGAFGNQHVGSGDIPMSTLSMALEIAAVTIGLELVPVIPATGPWAMLSYMDMPYGGGKTGRLGEVQGLDGRGPKAENKPIYIKFPLALTYLDKVPAHGQPGDADYTPAIPFTKKDLVPGTAVKVYHGNASAPATTGDVLFVGSLIGFSRIDNSVIAKVESAQGWNATDAAVEDISIADVFAKATDALVGDSSIATVTQWLAGTVKADLVAAAADHVQGFSNFFDGSDDPMSRAQNETGVGNTIGARMFTKLVQMGSYEVTGTVTRQQLQDMPLYGIDVIGKVLEAMQNEISQAINNRILDRVFRLGVDNAVTQLKYQGVNLNLFLNGVESDGKVLSDFDAWNKYLGTGEDAATRPLTTSIANVVVPNAIQNTAAENLTTHQRRIMSRVLAAANLIANVSRRGRGQWVVTNTQILSALQDASAFVVAPMVNTLSQDGSQSLYFAGSLAGLNLYVDPYMDWDDTRVCVGRKSTGNDPGVVFMPYILADTVSITAEGTMAPKMLCNSRFAIVDAGFHPEQSYYTFMVQTASDGAYII